VAAHLRFEIAVALDRVADAGAGVEDRWYLHHDFFLSLRVLREPNA
jgi:hypothetical protein